MQKTANNKKVGIFMRQRRIWSALLALLMMTSIICACSPSNATNGETITFTDDNGREVSLSSWEKVVVPQSSFADMWALAGGSIYATSQETFDEGVVELEEGTINVGSLKTPDLETILSSEVDFAILSSNVEGHTDVAQALDAAGIPCAFFDVETFDDYLRVLRILTDITGREDLYKLNGEDVQARIDAAIARKEGHEAPTVLYMRAYSTGVRAKGSDNMTGAMLKDMGCINLADSDESLLEDVSMEVVIAEDPDFIFVTTMGSSEEAAMQSLADSLQSNPAWAELSAVKNDRFVVLPKDLFHLKPNKRWGESYEMLADILYGEA